MDSPSDTNPRIGDQCDVARKLCDIDSIDVDRVLSRTRYGVSHRKPLYQAPEFLKRLSAFEESQAGETVIFECHWTGCPAPTIKWYHDDEEVTRDEPRCRFRLLSDGVLQLCIEEVGKKDEGAYKCKAENQEGVASTTGYLSVTDNRKKSLCTQKREQEKHEPRKTHQRSVSNPPNLRSIVEQKSMEEREADEVARQKPSPLQDFIDNIMFIRKENTWPLARIYRYDSDGDSTEDDTDFVDSHDSDTSVESAGGGGGADGEYDSVSYDTPACHVSRPHQTQSVSTTPDATPSHRRGVDVIGRSDSAPKQDSSSQPARQVAVRPRSLLLRSSHVEEMDPTNNSNDDVEEEGAEDEEDEEEDAAGDDNREEDVEYSSDMSAVYDTSEANSETYLSQSPADSTAQPTTDNDTDVSHRQQILLVTDAIPPEQPVVTTLRASTTEAVREHLHEFDGMWLFYAVFAAIATFIACQYAISPRSYIITVALIALVSFRFVLRHGARGVIHHASDA